MSGNDQAAKCQPAVISLTKPDKKLQAELMTTVILVTDLTVLQEVLHCVLFDGRTSDAIRFTKIYIITILTNTFN